MGSETAEKAEYRCMIEDIFIDVEASSEEEAKALAKALVIERLQKNEIEILTWRLACPD